MTDIEIRPYRPADRAAVLALAGRLTAGVAPWRDPGAVRQAVTGWVRESLDTGRTAFVAAAGDEIAGLVTVGTRTHFTGAVDAYVGELVVSASRERQGIGARLLHAAEAWSVRQGHDRLTVETGAANTAARAFYAAAGFAEEDVRLTRSLRRRAGSAAGGGRAVP